MLKIFYKEKKGLNYSILNKNVCSFTLNLQKRFSMSIFNRPDLKFDKSTKIETVRTLTVTSRDFTSCVLLFV